MEVPITVAIISSLTAFLSAGYAFYTRKTLDRTIEEVKAGIADRLKENDALRDYRYEAKKRLYNEYEPLFFQYTEASESALERIASLARTARTNNLGEKGWMFDAYYFSSTIYRLLVPFAIFRIIADKLTFIDFSLDKRIFFQYNLMKILIQTFSDDFGFAGYGGFSYNPNTEGWQEKRLKNERVHWRQGIPAGRLETSVNALLVPGLNQKKQVMNFGEFEEKFCNDPGFKKLFEGISDVLYNFQPENRPVLWAMLFTQAKLHHAFLQLQHDKFENSESLMATITGWEGEFEKRLIWSDQDESKMFDNYKKISSEYLKNKVGKYIIKMAAYDK